MGMLRPLSFVVAWAQPRICVRIPEAARPAIALPKKDLLFMRTAMGGHWRGGCGLSTRFPIERYGAWVRAMYSASALMSSRAGSVQITSAIATGVFWHVFAKPLALLRWLVHRGRYFPGPTAFPSA